MKWTELMIELNWIDMTWNESMDVWIGSGWNEMTWNQWMH